MNTQIFLIAPSDADIETFPALVKSALSDVEVSALLLPQGDRTQEDYENFARAILQPAQNTNCAVILDNAPKMAKKIGADGAHISTGINAFKEALDMLKPDMIVGAGALHSRHDAMTKAEAGADYVFFGPFSGTTEQNARDDADWWGETFEVPAVYCDPQADPKSITPADCEFLGVSDSIWSAPEGPAAALIALTKTLDDRQ